MWAWAASPNAAKQCSRQLVWKALMSFMSRSSANLPCPIGLNHFDSNSNSTPSPHTSAKVLSFSDQLSTRWTRSKSLAHILFWLLSVVVWDTNIRMLVQEMQYIFSITIVVRIQNSLPVLFSSSHCSPEGWNEYAMSLHEMQTDEWISLNFISFW